jgi:hypothetical protein
LAHITSHAEPSEFYLTFTTPGWEGSFQYDLVVGQKKGLVSERLAVDGQVVYSQRHGDWEHGPDVIPQISPGQIALATLSGRPEVTAAHVALTRGIGCYDFPGNVLQPSNVDPRGSPKRGLSDTGANYLPVVADILSDFERPRSWKQVIEPLAKLNPAVTAVTLQQPEQNNLMVAYQIGGQRVLFDVAQESEGFRRFLAQLLALYQSPRKQLLLFEHPENGIHPGALETLFEQFEDSPGEGRGQVILTTHSPQLLDHFKPEAIRVVEIKDQRTRIGPLDLDLVGVIRDNLLHPGELLTKTPPQIAEPAEVK